MLALIAWTGLGGRVQHVMVQDQEWQNTDPQKTTLSKESLKLLVSAAGAIRVVWCGAKVIKKLEEN